MSEVLVSFDGRGLKLDTSEDVEVICEALVDKHVEVLVLQGNTFNIEAAERLGQELANHPELMQAHFKDLFTSRGSEIVPEAMNHLLQGISDSGAQLVLLDLSDNAIGPVGAPPLIKFLKSQSCETLEKLYLNNCGLGPEGSTSIASCIPNLKNLRELICGRNRLEDKGAKNMSRALAELRNIEVLRLDQDGIRPAGICALLGALQANIETLEELDLSDNTIKADGARAIASALSRATNITTLRLSDALLENEGFEIICEALSKSSCCKTLREASFRGNELHGQKIIDLIASTFDQCDADFALDLTENEFTHSEVLRLEKLEPEYDILIDQDNEDEDYDEDEEEGEYRNGSNEDDSDDDKYSEDADSGDAASNGYVEIDRENELREIAQDYIATFEKRQVDHSAANSYLSQFFCQGQDNYNHVQILCEELGLMKSESTRKKKPLAMDAFLYIAKNPSKVSNSFYNFLTVVVQNSDELSCSKTLFQKLDI